MVGRELPKLETRVRFPVPAPSVPAPILPLLRTTVSQQGRISDQTGL